MPDLCALKLRGGKTRLHTCCWRDTVQVWFGCLAAHLCLFPFPLYSLTWECKAGSGTGRIIYSDTLQRVLSFMLPRRSTESTCCGDEDQQASGVHVCVTGAGCVSVSNRACYLCRLGHSYNRGHRILNRSGNTNLSLTSDLKELLYAPLVCGLCCLLDWCYLTRGMTLAI